MIADVVGAVRVGDSQVAITLDRASLASLLGIAALEPSTDDIPIVVTTSAVRVRHGKEVKMLLAADDHTAAARDTQLLELLADARDARDAVLASPNTTIKQIALATGRCRTRMARPVRLSWLAPDIVQAIVEGRHPVRLTPRLLLTTELPMVWPAPRAALGMP